MNTHTRNIIEVKDVSFRYAEQPVLDHISFTVHEGDYLGIIGPNGGGKTTLLKIMLGLLKPETGSVTFFGTDIKQFRDWQKIGYVPQKAIYFDVQFPATVSEVVAMGLTSQKGKSCFRCPREDEKILSALGDVDMLNFKDRLIGELSGGQQQRVLIARALVSAPAVLFLDEPTVGIDVTTQEQFYLLLKKLNETKGLTLILVSHDIDVVASQATEIACINTRLVYHGPPQELDANEHIKKLYGKEMKFILHDH